jgi:hypothetical protein
MPQTHTDDLTPALHSSIHTYTDDGGPRSLRVITIGYCRNYNAAAAQVIGSAIAARYVNANDVGGCYLLPFTIPQDMDVSCPSSVRILVNPPQNATTNGQKIRFTLQETHVPDGGPPQTSTLSCDWNVPDDWTTDDCNVALIDNGNGRTFEGDTFANGDTVGLRLSRSGSDPADTFDKAVRMAEYVQFEYTAKRY